MVKLERRFELGRVTIVRAMVVGSRGMVDINEKEEADRGKEEREISLSTIRDQYNIRVESNACECIHSKQPG